MDTQKLISFLSVAIVGFLLFEYYFQRTWEYFVRSNRWNRNRWCACQDGCSAECIFVDFEK